MNTAELSAAIRERVVLITGGTGSFGRTMVEQLVREGCREIRIFSRDELKQEQMRQELDCDRLRFYLGDVRKFASIDHAMHGVDVVFHAAALKQVPSCEFFPMEAVETNVAGSSNVIESAIKHRAKSVVCLGTDKAVYPVNAMGMTKALMEWETIGREQVDDIMAGREPRPPKDWKPRTPSSGGSDNGGAAAVTAAPKPTTA